MYKVRNIVKNRVFNFNHVFKVLTKQGISSRPYFAFDILAVAVLLSFWQISTVIFLRNVCQIYSLGLCCRAKQIFIYFDYKVTRKQG